VSVADGFHLWSEHYDCNLTDIFSIQDEISRSIACALALRLTPPRIQSRIADPKAYNCWLKARHYQQYENLAQLPKCRAALEEAIALDSLFPQPYITLADLLLLTVHLGSMNPRDALAQGRAALDKALELDDSLGELHALSGAYRAWMDFDWQRASADFDRALELAPASERVRTLRAKHLLVPTGRLQEAEREMQVALESDPLSLLAYIEFAKVLFWERRFEQGEAVMRTALELWPEHPLARWFMGSAMYFQGRTEEALELWEESFRKLGDDPVMSGAIVMALGKLGRQAEARKMLVELQATALNRYVSSFSFAMAHVGLGEFDAALEMLDRAIDERDPHILELPHKPIWDCLQADSRYRSLLLKMHLG
jgi:tetratricopeptide (TPR) repeat protein